MKVSDAIWQRKRRNSRVLKSTEPPCEVVSEHPAVLCGAGAIHVENVVEEFWFFENFGAVFIAEDDTGF